MAAAPAKKRARKKPGRPLAVGALIGAAILVAVVVWASMAHSGQPAQQQRVAMPGMGEHLVNLWVEPADSPQARRFTAQVTDIGGWPEGVSGVVFSVTGADQEQPVEAPGVYSAEGPGRGQVYRTTIEMPGPGPWQVTVRFAMSGQTSEAIFSVEAE